MIRQAVFLGCLLFYIDVSARTGCIFEALIAGASPAVIPMMVANRMLCRDWLNVNPTEIISDGIRSPANPAVRSPIAPPVQE